MDVAVETPVAPNFGSAVDGVDWGGLQARAGGDPTTKDATPTIIKDLIK